MQQPRKTSFFKKLLGAKQRQSVEPKKGLQPLDKRELNQVAGGTTTETGTPRSTW